MSDAAVPAPSLPYRVVSQVPQLVLNSANQRVPGYVITAQVKASGTTFTVNMPAGTYTLASVQAALNQAYEQIAAVDTLGS